MSWSLCSRGAAVDDAGMVMMENQRSSPAVVRVWDFASFHLMSVPSGKKKGGCVNWVS